MENGTRQVEQPDISILDCLIVHIKIPFSGSKIMFPVWHNGFFKILKVFNPPVIDNVQITFFIFVFYGGPYRFETDDILPGIIDDIDIIFRIHRWRKESII